MSSTATSGLLRCKAPFEALAAFKTYTHQHMQWQEVTASLTGAYPVVPGQNMPVLQDDLVAWARAELSSRASRPLVMKLQMALRHTSGTHT